MNEIRDRGLGAAPRVVLIVVDDPSHRVLFNRHLKSTHHHLVYAVDGEDGFDRFTECKPHLVIAQFNLPRLDGTILCQLIRQDPRGAEVAVVLAGDVNDEPEGPARAIAVAADAYLAMPFSPDDLTTCLQPLLQDGRPPFASSDISQERPVVSAPAGGRPATELTFGSMLADFMSQTDEAVAAGQASLTDPGLELSSRPVSRPGTGGDMDTVVSFKNPFFEGEAAAGGVQPQVIEPSPSLLTSPGLPGVAIIEAPLGQEEPPTPVGRALGVEGPGARVSSDLGNEQPITELAPSPSPSGQLVAAALPEAPTQDKVPVVVPPGQPLNDPLEEPKISGPGSGIRPMPEPSGHSRLIREVPLEGTPSDDHRVSQVQKRSGGQRRGLDESQLGKRLSKRVRTMHRLLDEVDYYQLLGVDRGADHDALRRAYFDLSLEFHPDRFFLLRSGDLKEKIYDIYRRIAEAYRVLGDDRKRQTYDEARSLSSVKRAAADLRGEAQAPRVASEPGEAPELNFAIEGQDALRFADLAREAYGRGDFNAARLHLVFAQHYEPENASVQAALHLVAKQRVPFS